MEITQATMSNRSLFDFQAQRHINHRRNLKRRRKVANDFLFPGDSALSEARGQNLKSTPSLLYIMKFMVPCVLVLVTLKYQAKPDILFGENPVPLCCFVAAGCVYWLLVEKMKQMTTLNGKWSQILSHAVRVSGILSSLSLVSMFIPYTLSLVPLLIWIPLLVVFAWPRLYDAYILLKRGITIIINKIHAILVWARGLNSKEEAFNLPV